VRLGSRRPPVTLRLGARHPPAHGACRQACRHIHARRGYIHVRLFLVSTGARSLPSSLPSYTRATRIYTRVPLSSIRRRTEPAVKPAVMYTRDADIYTCGSFCATLSYARTNVAPHSCGATFVLAESTSRRRVEAASATLTPSRGGESAPLTATRFDLHRPLFQSRRAKLRILVFLSAAISQFGPE
jgi:hypothetical protein